MISASQVYSSCRPYQSRRIALNGLFVCVAHGRITPATALIIATAPRPSIWAASRRRFAEQGVSARDFDGFFSGKEVAYRRNTRWKKHSTSQHDRT